MNDIAHLGHVELYTNQFDASLDFFTRVYGLTLTEQDATSAYLRAFDDYEHHSLKLTRHHTDHTLMQHYQQLLQLMSC